MAPGPLLFARALAAFQDACAGGPWAPCGHLGHLVLRVSFRINLVSAAIKATWEEWNTYAQENSIFWNFIKEERNNLLKEYKFGVQPEPEYLVTEKGDRLVTEKGEPLVTSDDFFRLSHVGFESKEGRDVIDEAIKWWRKQLDAIEAQL